MRFPEHCVGHLRLPLRRHRWTRCANSVSFPTGRFWGRIESSEGQLLSKPTDWNGSIALLRSFEQRPLDSFFASAGIADARTSASEISARRARRCATSAVPWNQSFRMSRYERMNGCSWPVSDPQPKGSSRPSAALRRRLANVSSAAGPVIRGPSVNSRSRPHSGHPGAREIVTPMTALKVVQT